MVFFRPAIAGVLFAVPSAVCADQEASGRNDRSALLLENLPVSLDANMPDDCPSCFKPNFDFPRSAVDPGAIPWEGIDFTKDPEAYLDAVLGYVLEGMDRETWNVHANTVREWYHAPWLHAQRGFVKTGREYIMGLTEELQSGPHDLGPDQHIERTNWAVSFFNATAAHTYHQVWGDGSEPPNWERIEFAPGSVFAKALYTTATPDEVPILQGAPTMTANVSEVRWQPQERSPRPLWLLQFDVAVKVSEDAFERYTGASDRTNWVYGSFLYDGRIPGDDPWEKLSPLGLSWGNDPDVADYSGEDIKESRVLHDGFTITRRMYGQWRTPDFGRSGRLNGPIDNPLSSCSSCHGAAQYKVNKSSDADHENEVARLPWPPGATDPTPILDWWQRDECLFLNRAPFQPLGDVIKPGESESFADMSLDKKCFTGAGDYVTTDTSLQIAFGLNHYCKFILAKHDEVPADRVKQCAPSLDRSGASSADFDLPESSPDGTEPAADSNDAYGPDIEAVLRGMPENLTRGAATPPD